MGWLRRFADGLSSFGSSQSTLSRPEASIPRREATFIHLRDMRTPAKHWDQKVLYDAWGSPYIAKGSYGLETAIYPDGTTGDTHLRGTEWRHKSGPPVVFAKKPSRPFEDAA